jgi:hypothetical protein
MNKPLNLGWNRGRIAIALSIILLATSIVSAIILLRS